MIPGTGTGLERSGDQNTEVLFQKGQNLQLISNLSFDSTRSIRGIFHIPTLDKENEIILAKAIEDALPQYMEHPILHYQHTERPVGIVTKAEIKGEEFHLEADIFDSPDTDDVWMDIQKGILNKFSIYGRRLEATPECRLQPNQRVNPCITKALTLWSISVVGNNAINEKTFLEVAKSFCTKYNQDEVFKSSDGKSKEESGMEEKEEKKEEEVEKSDLATEPTNISQIMSRLATMESTLERLVSSDKQVHESMKGEDEMTENEKKEEEVEKCSDGLKKAEETVAVAPDTITKAIFDSEIKKAREEIDEIKKGYTDLEARVKKMEETTIQKGGNVVVLAGDSDTNNPLMGNLKAIGVI